MKLRSWIPVLLGLSAVGCGVDHKILGPVPSSSSLRNAPMAMQEAGQWAPGVVYTMTNATSGNAVLAYPRAANGTLGTPRSYPTGGTGTGASLGDQGALALGAGDRWLFVVNAGSNEVSVFGTGPSGLSLASRVSSGGVEPVSVTTHGNLVYVLNAGGAGNIQGFFLSPSGGLTAIPGSNRPLSSSSAGAAEIGFSPEGTALVVTEKATNTLSLYRVAADGSATGPVADPSSGTTPYGFGFTQTGTVVVSEAFGGAANGSAVSSYRVHRDGRISLVSGSVPTNQTSACWIAVSQDGRLAFAANAASSSVTGYAVDEGGALTRLGGAATPTAAGPTEMSFSNGSRFLYVLSPGSKAINTYAVDAAGHLHATGQLTATPAGITGLVAR